MLSGISTKICSNSNHNFFLEWLRFEPGLSNRGEPLQLTGQVYSFYRLDAFAVAQPTLLKHWREIMTLILTKQSHLLDVILIHWFVGERTSHPFCWLLLWNIKLLCAKREFVQGLPDASMYCVFFVQKPIHLLSVVGSALKLCGKLTKFILYFVHWNSSDVPVFRQYIRSVHLFVLHVLCYVISFLGCPCFSIYLYRWPCNVLTW